jgi:hypothetical protein
MTTKSGEKAKPNKTRDRVSQVLSHAKESLKLLETLEKETLARARKFVSAPLSQSRRNLTNDKILCSLKKLGVASQDEVNRLKTRIERLESELLSRASSKVSESREHSGAIPRA